MGNGKSTRPELTCNTHTNTYTHMKGEKEREGGREGGGGGGAKKEGTWTLSLWVSKVWDTAGPEPVRHLQCLLSVTKHTDERVMRVTAKL